MLGLNINHVSKRSFWKLSFWGVFVSDHQRNSNLEVGHSGSGFKWAECLLFINGYLGWPHDDVIKWKHFPRNWPFVRGIHRSPVNSPHKGQWRGALMFALICVWINGWVNNREAGDLRRHRAHYDVVVMTRIQNEAIVCRHAGKCY